MKILLLTATPDKAGPFAERMKTLAEYMTARGNTLEHHELSGMDIRYCTGCFNCWWKTPGRCTFTDDMEVLYPGILKSDLLVFASPLVMGLPSYIIKRCQDRLIPLVHPYITLVKGECHHRKRYDRYPDISLITQKETDTEAEDIEMLEKLYRRLALNLHATFRGIGFIDMTDEEVCNEACRV